MAFDIKGAVKMIRDFVVSLAESGRDIAIAIVVLGAILFAVVGGGVSISGNLSALLSTLDNNFATYMTTGVTVLATVAAFIVVVVLMNFFKSKKGGDMA